MGAAEPRPLHLRSWCDAEGFAWSDTCGCSIGEDHEAVFPEHEAVRLTGPYREDWAALPCRCSIGEDHDYAGRLAPSSPGPSSPAQARPVESKSLPE